MDNILSPTYYLTNHQFRHWVFHPNQDLNHYWDEWMVKNPKSKEAIEQARLILLSSKFKEHSMNQSDQTALWHKIETQTLKSRQAKKINNRFINWDYYSKIAATILVVVLTVYLIYDFASVDDDKKVTSLVVTQNIVKHTKWGERLTITLPDGSEVKLNAGTTITYPEKFLGNERKVILSGEAYFKVAKDTTKPFKVVSGNVITEALGTVFFINNYSGNDSTLVALTEGKIKVSSDEQDIIVTPGQMISYLPSTNKLKAYSHISDELLSWKDNLLIFEHADWNEIERKLERWYGVEIENNKNQNKWNYSARFKDYSLENVLKSICYAKNLSFEFKQDKVMIY